MRDLLDVKVVELTFILFHFFSSIYNYSVIDNLAEDGYHETSGYLGRFDSKDA